MAYLGPTNQYRSFCENNVLTFLKFYVALTSELMSNLTTKMTQKFIFLKFDVVKLLEALYIFSNMKKNTTM